MKKSHLFYLAATLGIYMFAVYITEGSWLYFIDIPSFLITPFVSLLLMLGHFRPGEIIEAFRAAGTGDRDSAEIKRAIIFFNTFGRLNMLSGWFSVILGLVLVLTTYPSENFDKNIGKYMAVCIIPIAYYLFLVMTICVPFESALEKKLVK